MKTNEELESELKIVEAQISNEYWRFTRTSSSSVKPVNSELYVRKASIIADLKGRKADGVTISRPSLATEESIEALVVRDANRTLKKMAKYGWTYEQAYAQVNIYRHQYRFAN